MRSTPFLPYMGNQIITFKERKSKEVSNMPELITTKYEAEKEEAREMMQLFQGLEHDEKATVKGMMLGIKLVREVKEGKSA